MSVMLFKLRGVEEDEADEIRALLTDHDIDFYETTNGRWGLGFAAIWLRDGANFVSATDLIHAYQQQRFLQARASYEALCSVGDQQTFWKKLKTRPLQILLAIIAMMIVGLFVLAPFVLL